MSAAYYRERMRYCERKMRYTIRRARSCSVRFFGDTEAWVDLAHDWHESWRLYRRLLRESR